MMDTKHGKCERGLSIDRNVISDGSAPPCIVFEYYNKKRKVSVCEQRFEAVGF